MGLGGEVRHRTKTPRTSGTEKSGEKDAENQISFRILEFVLNRMTPK